MSRAPETVTSHFDRYRKVSLDLWGDNPLVEDYRQIRPGFIEDISQVASPPTLFDSGDLPPFTASGVEPQVLRRLPYTARHAAAAEPSPAAVLGLIEEYGSDSTVELQHTGLDQYRQRVTRWLTRTGLDEEQPSDESREEDYAALFGTTEPKVASE